MTSKPDWLLTHNTKQFTRAVVKRTGVRIATPAEFFSNTLFFASVKSWAPSALDGISGACNGLEARPASGLVSSMRHSLRPEALIAGRLLIVAHADRGENIRIISARKTTLCERKQYQQEN